MPNLEQGQIIALTCQYTVYGQRNLLTHHYFVNRTGGFGDVSLSDAFSDWATWSSTFGGLENVIVDVFGQDVSMNFAQFQIIYPTRYAYVRGVGFTGTGSVVGGTLPQNVAAVITLRSDLSGRNQISNKHIGGVPATFTENGEVTTDAIEDYQLVQAALLSTVNVGDAPDTFALIPVIYHKGGLTTSDTLVTGSVQNTIRVMRRRTVGLGI